MSSEEKEYVNEEGFQFAMQSLATVETLSAIQKLAQNIVGTDIGICYSKLKGDKHQLCFVVHPQGQSIKVGQLIDLTCQLYRTLSYSNLVVVDYSDFSKAIFDTQFSALTPISPVSTESHRKVQDFLQTYNSYLRGEMTEKVSETEYRGSPFIGAKEKSPAQKLAPFALSHKVSAEPTQKRSRSGSGSDDSGSVPSAGSSPDTIRPPGTGKK